MRWHPTTYCKEASPSPLPYLSIDQHRPVTPVPPDDLVETLPVIPDEADPVPIMGPLIARNGIFFQKLPPEIRTEILKQAFGTRTIHIDLIYGYRASPGRKTHHHGGVRQLL